MTLDQVMAAAEAIRIADSEDDYWQRRTALRAAIEAYGQAQRERAAVVCESHPTTEGLRGIFNGPATAIRALRGNE